MSQYLHCLAALALIAVPSLAVAEAVRYRYVPTNAGGAMAQVPIGPDGSLGELRRFLGARALPYPHTVRPTQMVTFRHPYTRCNVTVPIRLPYDQPRMEHQTDRIIYNYGDYTVEARFLPDGAVDVVYNSGLFRPLKLD
jgi:hypothetical protein